MILHRLQAVGASCLLLLIAGGCSGIADGVEQLSYNSNTSTNTSSNSGNPNQPASGLSGTPLPSTASANGTTITISKYDVNTTTIVDGQNLNVHWAVESSPTDIYVAEFYLVDTLDPDKLSSSTPAFKQNGGYGPPLVGKEATITCHWQVSGGATTLICPNDQELRLTSLSPLYAVLRACTFGLTETVCTQSAITLSASATAGVMPAGAAATPVATTDTIASPPPQPPSNGGQ